MLATSNDEQITTTIGGCRGGGGGGAGGGGGVSGWPTSLRRWYTILALPLSGFKSSQQQRKKGHWEDPCTEGAPIVQIIYKQHWKISMYIEK